MTVIDREQIELSGDLSVADFLRNIPFNTFGSFRPQSGSSAQSFAGLSLRGLGEGRTLILIDGRRAPTAPNIGSAQDLNIIPWRRWSGSRSSPMAPRRSTVRMPSAAW